MLLLLMGYCFSTMDKLREELNSYLDKGDERLVKMLLAAAKEYVNTMENESENSSSSALYRLVYTSARSKSCDDAEIEKILEASRRNNKALGVTGMLVYTQDRFLQVLEGEHDKVMSLYHKIEKDRRHGGTNMRFCEEVSTRYFLDWDMASKKMDEADIEYKSSVSESKKELYRSMMNGDIHSYKDEGMRVLKTFLLFS